MGVDRSDNTPRAARPIPSLLREVAHVAPTSGREGEGIEPRAPTRSITFFHLLCVRRTVCTYIRVHDRNGTINTSPCFAVPVVQTPGFAGNQSRALVAVLGSRLGNRFKRGSGKKKTPRKRTIHQII